MSTRTLAKLSFSRNDNIRYKMSNVNGTIVSNLLLFFIEEREVDPFFESFNGNSVNCLNDRGRLVDYGDNMRCLDDNVSINYIIYLNLRVLTTTVSHDFESYNERLFKFMTPLGLPWDGSLQSCDRWWSVV